MKPISRKRLEQFVAATTPQAAQPTAQAAPIGDRFIDAFLARHPELEFKASPYRGGRRFILKACPFDASHVGSSVAIFEGADGRLGFKCQHNSCADNHWAEFREKIEPDSYAAGVGASSIANAAAAASLNGAPSPPFKLKFKTGAEALREIKERGEKKSFWGKHLLAGELSLLVGRPYAGKSSLAMSLAKHLTFGMPFLNFTCLKTKVLYCALERNSRFVVEHLTEMWKAASVVYFNEIPTELLSLPQFSRGATPEAAAARVALICAAMEAEIKACKVEVMIIDNLQAFARISNVNDYGLVSLLLEPINRLAQKHNIHIVCLVHQGKADHEGPYIEVLGSEALRAASDLQIECKLTQDGNYTVYAQGRGDAGFKKMRIQIDMDDGTATVTDSRIDEINIATRRISMLLSSSGRPMLRDEIQKAVGLKAETVLLVITENPTIDRVGSGQRGDPYRYVYRSSGEPSDAERAAGLRVVERMRAQNPSQMNSEKGEKGTD